ncbi:hypothetical protein [Pseudoalteromonas sp. McH1-42]|uniref:hypothetical protein n=1 Tax=Pseudoalteromonas sp. McH1-42 TaxID=2917752 RepID=UPI001EF4A735|nr:hypothetical protein [Pseudoalteromonas sp. McH1-42]MCG7564562.1 hypothetical protein [Pseudoalteromonas sp. McH1-42]
MNNLPIGFYVDNLYCFPVGPSGSQRFCYLPTTPRIEVLGNEVKARILNSDDAAVLALQIVWEADTDTIEKAKSEIKNRYPELSFINLSLADFRGVTATLNINKNDKVIYSIGPINTSGPDMFRAAFQDTLKSAEKEAVLNAFNTGESGVITIVYDGYLKLNEIADAEFDGDLATEIKALAPREVEEKGKGFFSKKHKILTPSPSLQECKDAVGKAIENKSLIIQHKDSANVSKKAKDTVIQEIINDISQCVFTKIEEVGKNSQYISSYCCRIKKTKAESVKFNLKKSYDLVGTISESRGRDIIEK